MPNVRRSAAPRHGILIALAVALTNLNGTHAQATAKVQTYACQPSLSVFCRNIHVSCAGATRIPTAPFTITITGGQARIQTHGRPAAAGGHVFRSKGVLIEVAASNDWIRIEPGGRYSHRIYRPAGAAMSYGTCQLLTH